MTTRPSRLFRAEEIPAHTDKLPMLHEIREIGECGRSRKHQITARGERGDTGLISRPPGKLICPTRASGARICGVQRWAGIPLKEPALNPLRPTYANLCATVGRTSACGGGRLIQRALPAIETQIFTENMVVSSDSESQSQSDGEGDDGCDYDIIPYEDDPFNQLVKSDEQINLPWSRQELDGPDEFTDTGSSHTDDTL